MTLDAYHPTLPANKPVQILHDFEDTVAAVNNSINKTTEGNPGGPEVATDLSLIPHSTVQKCSTRSRVYHLGEVS